MDSLLGEILVAGLARSGAEKRRSTQSGQVYLKFGIDQIRSVEIKCTLLCDLGPSELTDNTGQFGFLCRHEYMTSWAVLESNSASD